MSADADMTAPGGFLGLVSHPWNGVGLFPAELARPCHREGCEGTMRPVDGTQLFSDSGRAEGFLVCDRCRTPRSVWWDWRHYTADGDMRHVRGSGAGGASGALDSVGH